VERKAGPDGSMQQSAAIHDVKNDIMATACRANTTHIATAAAFPYIVGLSLSLSLP
jgi:hypothetical protein